MALISFYWSLVRVTFVSVSARFRVLLMAFVTSLGETHLLKSQPDLVQVRDKRVFQLTEQVVKNSLRQQSRNLLAHIQTKIPSTQLNGSLNIETCPRVTQI